jgi:hypothetical protein
MTLKLVRKKVTITPIEWQSLIENSLRSRVTYTVQNYYAYILLFRITSYNFTPYKILTEIRISIY